MTFGGAVLESIEYAFYKGRLSTVTVIAKGAENEKKLLEEALRLFGRETVRSGEDYMWRFTRVAVMYSFEPQFGQAALFYQHLKR
jgi:hypothetical protein